MSFVAIVKTAKEHRLWKGQPDAYPILCEEFDTLEEAMAKHPGKVVMTVADYKEHAERYHSEHPRPVKRSWWSYLIFWRRN